MPMTVQLSEKTKKTIQGLCDEYSEFISQPSWTVTGAISGVYSIEEKMESIIERMEKVANKGKYDPEYFYCENAQDTTGKLYDEKDYDANELNALQKELVQQLQSEWSKITWNRREAVVRKETVEKTKKHLTRIAEKSVTSSETSEHVISLKVKFSHQYRTSLIGLMRSYKCNISYLKKDLDYASYGYQEYKHFEYTIRDQKELFDRVKDIKYDRNCFDCPYVGPKEKIELHKKLGNQLIEQLKIYMENLKTPANICEKQYEIRHLLNDKLRGLCIERNKAHKILYARLFTEKKIKNSQGKYQSLPEYLEYKSKQLDPAKQLEPGLQERLSKFMENVKEKLQKHRFGGNEHVYLIGVTNNNNVAPMEEIAEDAVKIINNLQKEFDDIAKDFTLFTKNLKNYAQDIRQALTKLKESCEAITKFLKQPECQELKSLGDEYFKIDWCDNAIKILEEIASFLDKGVSDEITV